MNEIGSAVKYGGENSLEKNVSLASGQYRQRGSIPQATRDRTKCKQKLRKEWRPRVGLVDGQSIST